jgi:hypothetical protein
LKIWLLLEAVLMDYMSLVVVLGPLRQIVKLNTVSRWKLYDNVR